MQLVNEEDRPRLFDLVDDSFQALFKLPPIHRPGDERADIQHDHSFAQQNIGRFIVNNTLGQPFDDGRLAHARLPNEGWIVFCATG